MMRKTTQKKRGKYTHTHTRTHTDTHIYIKAEAVKNSIA